MSAPTPRLAIDNDTPQQPAARSESSVTALPAARRGRWTAQEVRAGFKAISASGLSVGWLAGRGCFYRKIRHPRTRRVAAACPLKLVSATAPDSWYIRGTVRGVIVDEKHKGCPDKALAEAVRAKREWEIVTRQIGGNRAVATFLEAAVSYIETGGEARYVKPLIDYFKHDAAGADWPSRSRDVCTSTSRAAVRRRLSIAGFSRRYPRL